LQDYFKEEFFETKCVVYVQGWWLALSPTKA
jgi:hypothetical protein